MTTDLRSSRRRQTLVAAMPPPLRRRLLVYYTLLALLTAGAVAALLSAGGGKRPQPVIAGGYAVTAGARCVGANVQLIQSGRYVDLQNASGATVAKLTFENRLLTGTAHCRGGERHVRALVRGKTVRSLAGSLPLSATFKQAPPPPGTQIPRAPGALDGQYTLAPRSLCLGDALTLSGPSGALHDGAAGGRAALRLRYRHGTLEGPVICQNGQRRELYGLASGRAIDLAILPPHSAVPAAGAAAPPTAERLTATKQRTLDDAVAAFFLAIVVVIVCARLVGNLMPRIGQPRVMGEVLAGIVLGPTVVGKVAPGVEVALFPSDIIPYLGVVANLGLIFYMFLIGLELDFSALRGRLAQTIAISNTGVAIPMVAGIAVALPLYELLSPHTRFAAFALFMGVSMSITAFPVLARIVSERRMTKRPIGALALASAAVDDVTAWFLVALASAVAAAGSSLVIVRTIGLTVAFCVVMFALVRPILRRASVAYDEAGRVPPGWITVIFAAVLLSAYATQQIGIAVIFGAFVMGTVMPRHAGLTEDVTRRVEDFVVTLLLPLFFVFTGLRTNFFELDRPALLWITLGLVAVAIACKFGGAVLAARVTKLGWRDSALIGTLMNTRGLTELIVLNLALDKGVISSALFASLVIMALLTTSMTGPLLRVLDRASSFGEVDRELEQAKRESEREIEVPLPERSIIVAPHTDAAAAQLEPIARLLASSQPPREVILARLVAPPRGAAFRGGLQTESRLVSQATRQLEETRARLLDEGVAARAIAFTSSRPGEDLVRLAEREHVDLVLLDGWRPLIRSGVPRGDVGAVLREASADVAVLVARGRRPVVTGPQSAVVVPFGGAEHDWAALELGAWIASASDAPLKLLGTAQERDGRDPTRLLANASLLVQRFVGVPAEPLLAEHGGEGVVSAADGAGLLVIGLSDRWRQEGLGEVRAELARAAPAPILFVRRGSRPGALAPRDDVTRFTWSSPGVGTSVAEPTS